MSFKPIDAILACDPIGVIGKEGKLPWNYKEELAHFKRTIQGSILVMGRLTYVSLPDSYAKNHKLFVFTTKPHEPKENVTFIQSIDDFLSFYHLFDARYFVIGGAQIVKQFIEAELINQLILTHLKYRHQGDTFFPLSLIEKWPYEKIQEFKQFTVYKYFKPSFLD